MELLERPPNRLDVIIRAGYVGMIEINPVSHALGKFLPPCIAPYIAKDELSALLIKGFDTIFDNIGLMLESKFLFDRNLDRQAVRIPSRLARNPVTLHRLIPADNILQRPRKDMVDARNAVNGGRTFVKREHIPC